MGHNISAIVAKGVPKSNFRNIYDLPIISLPQGFSMVGLDDEHCDYWFKKLRNDISDNFKAKESYSGLNGEIIQFWAQLIYGRRFALIETEYHGGTGGQSAVLYEGSQIEFESEEDDSINKVLRMLGVRITDYDEFDSLELRNYRSFTNFFSDLKYLKEHKS